MKTKTCSKCKIKKPITEFYKHSLHIDGLASQCKEGRKLTDKKYNVFHKKESRYNEKN